MGCVKAKRLCSVAAGIVDVVLPTTAGSLVNGAGRKRAAHRGSVCYPMPK